LGGNAQGIFCGTLRSKDRLTPFRNNLILIV